MATDQIKKLLFRAWHRGTREADLLMGRFAEDFLQRATPLELDLFERLLEESDPDIYNWITTKVKIPENEIKPIIQQMIQFYKLNK